MFFHNIVVTYHSTHKVGCNSSFLTIATHLFFLHTGTMSPSRTQMSQSQSHHMRPNASTNMTTTGGVGGAGGAAAAAAGYPTSSSAGRRSASSSSSDLLQTKLRSLLNHTSLDNGSVGGGNDTPDGCAGRTNRLDSHPNNYVESYQHVPYASPKKVSAAIFLRILRQ